MIDKYPTMIGTVRDVADVIAVNFARENHLVVSVKRRRSHNGGGSGYV